MRVLDGEQVLARIFIGESDRWHHQPLSMALLERLRREGFAGATVFNGVAGFGARSVLHTSHLLRLSEDLPVVIEVVDTEQHIDRLLPILDEMVSEGLVTLERRTPPEGVRTLRRICRIGHVRRRHTPAFFTRHFWYRHEP
jgi:PII-like signaling protein